MPKEPTRLTRFMDRSLPWVNRFLTIVLILTLIGIGAFWFFVQTPL